MVKYREAALGETRESLIKYTSSIRYDARIIDKVILVTVAHVAHLYRKGYIPKDEASKIITELRGLYYNNELKMELLGQNAMEDIFEAVEDFLEKRAGHSAYYIPLGRSRNDHVVAAIKLEVLDQTVKLLESLYRNTKALLSLAYRNLETPFVIHTHTMPGQITSYAHYLASIAEEILDIYETSLGDLKMILKSPLGSGAGAGTSADLDREELATLLGFFGITVNTLYSTSSRVFLDRVMRILSMISVTLSRVANDFIIYSHNSIGLINPPLEHVQTSSIMPQKKNPATLEIARARLKKILANANYLSIVESGIPSGYSLDLQELTPVVWESFDICLESVDIIFDFIMKSSVNAEKVDELIYEGGILATEVAEALTINKNVPYRIAHQKVASALRRAGWDLKKAVEILMSEENVELSRYLDWKNALLNKGVEGSPHPQKTERHLQKLGLRLEELFKETSLIKERFYSQFNELIHLKI